MLTVAFFARVGGKQFVGLGRELSFRIEFEFERRGKAFAARIVRLARDDQRDHRTLWVKRLEGAYLLVDVVAVGGGG
jgi:ribosomal protein L20